MAETSLARQEEITPPPIRQERILSPYASTGSFEVAQRMAKQLSASAIIPTEYQGNISNCIVALELASRLNASPLAVMQNCDVIHGKPSFRASFMIGLINGSGKFATDLQFALHGDGDARTCIAWVIDQGGTRIEGPPISIKMAKDEGWYSRNGSKWQTLPELMLRYRAAAFFARLHTPDLLLGMHTSEERYDTIDVTPPPPQEQPKTGMEGLKAAAQQATQSTAPPDEPGDAGDLLETYGGTEDPQPFEVAVPEKPGRTQGSTVKDWPAWQEAMVEFIDASANKEEIEGWMEQNKDTLEKCPGKILSKIEEAASLRHQEFTEDKDMFAGNL